MKKKQTAAAKMKNKREHKAQVARVEREIKVVQNEATQSLGSGRTEEDGRVESRKPSHVRRQ